MSWAIAASRKRAAAARPPVARRARSGGSVGGAGAGVGVGAGAGAADDGMDADDAADGAAAGNAAAHVAVLFEGGRESRFAVAVYRQGPGDIEVASLPCSLEELPWLLECVREQVVTPETIVTSSVFPESGRRELSRPSRGGDGAGGANVAAAVPVRVLKQAVFSVASARRVLGVLTTAEWLRADARQQQQQQGRGGLGAAGAAAGGVASGLARLSSCINLNDSLAVRACGGLLSFLVSMGVLHNDASGGAGGGAGAMDDGSDEDSGEGAVGDASGGALCIVLPGRVRQLPLTGFMQVDGASLAALSIFTPAGLSRAGTREGFSLAALLDRTRSAPGSRMLRAWLRRPSTDVPTIAARHDAVAFLLSARAQAPELWRDLGLALRKSKDVPRVLTRLVGVKAGLGDWAALECSLVTCGIARDSLSMMLSSVAVPPALCVGSASAQAPQLVVSMLSQLGELESLLGTINRVVDWGSSKLEGRVVVNDGVHQLLDALRQLAASIPERLSALAARDLAETPSLRSLAYRYLPQIGIVAVVGKVENGIAVGDWAGGGGNDGLRMPTPMPRVGTANSTTGFTPRKIVPLAGEAATIGVVPTHWVLQYETAGALHYKSPAAIELDEHWGDPTTMISDLEGRFVRELEDIVLGGYADRLTLAGCRLAELDALCSFADCAGDHNYTRPRMVEDPVILAKGARHPLQELTVDSFVPNDVSIDPSRESTVIVTGPNACGKSVWLKTVGVLCFMAQAGCFVPAEACVLGVVDRLFTRIHAVESVAASLPGAVAAGESAFAIDVAQVGLMLRHATPRSLCLLDEFGKGTDALDGVSLLAATVRALACLGAAPPKTVGE